MIMRWRSGGGTRLSGYVGVDGVDRCGVRVGSSVTFLLPVSLRLTCAGWEESAIIASLVNLLTCLSLAFLS